MERGYSGDDEAPSTALRSHHLNVSGRRWRSAASQYSRKYVGSLEASGASQQVARGYSGEAPSTALRSHHALMECQRNCRRRSRSAARHRGDFVLAYESRLAIARKLATESPVNSLIMSMFMVVLLYVQLKYEGKKEGVFEDNPVPVWSSLVTCCVYLLIATTIKQMPKPDDGESLIHEILERAAIVSGVFSIVSLLSIFLPHRISLFFLLLILPPLLVTLAWPALCHAYISSPETHAKVIMRIIWYWITSTVVDYIRDKVVSWTRGNNFTQEASLPA